MTDSYGWFVPLDPGRPFLLMIAEAVRSSSRHAADWPATSAKRCRGLYSS